MSNSQTDTHACDTLPCAAETGPVELSSIKGMATEAANRLLIFFTDGAQDYPEGFDPSEDACITRAAIELL